MLECGWGLHGRGVSAHMDAELAKGYDPYGAAADAAGWGGAGHCADSIWPLWETMGIPKNFGTILLFINVGLEDRSSGFRMVLVPQSARNMFPDRFRCRQRSINLCKHFKTTICMISGVSYSTNVSG